LEERPQEGIPDKLAERLAGFCRASLEAAGGLQVQGLSKLSDGWESEIYSFTARDDSGKAHDLVLRMYPGNPSSAPDRKCEREYTVMRTVWEAGYPVPRVFGMEKDAAVLGKPFLIMERIRGQSFEAFFNQAAPSDKPALFRLVVDLFARLHDLDWRPFWEALAATSRQGAPEPDTQSLMEAELAGYSKLVADLDEKEYGSLIGWLVRQLPPVNPAEPSLIHLDFHTRNILMTQDAKPYVIDWTGAMVSDYRFDVAWSLIFVDPTMQDDFLSMYRSLSGRDLKDLDYFRALAWSRRVMSIMISIRYGAEKLGMRPGAENVMRRNPRHIESVYRNLVNATGVRLPDVERLLEELNRPV